MNILELLSIDSIKLDCKAVDKNEAISKMVDLLANSNNIIDKNIFKKEVLSREKINSTGIGEGIAIPHGKSSVVTKPGLVAAVIPDGVDYESLDGRPVNLLFLIAAPDTKDNVHLDVLSRLSTLSIAM